MFVGKGKGENKILKKCVWTIIFKIFFPKYLVVRRTTRSQFLVVLTHFLVVEDTRTRDFCYPESVLMEWFLLWLFHDIILFCFFVNSRVIQLCADFRLAIFHRK